ncbi:MAG TPA: sugar ABC transporter permease [Candidatus Mediterraneibacter gallistercoris]|uniref:Sugar ABC transporter permease n=1 Tax=Candidatus Mediterraneibacter gallistercoris TaxID=2838671 RepID=A0A9D2P272_9FIRM|nr:sugar ABC transporter permease [Candidatus Mediterraneibacter gallistercoris]
MFKRRPLQSKSEIWMRNIAMGFLIIYMTIFLIIPVIIVIAGSFHQWNPLNQTYNWIGLDNYIRMFSYPTFWQSMGNTVIFCVVVVFFRVLLGLAIAYALNSKLMKHKTLFRTIFYMPTVTPLVAVAYVWKIMYNPQFGLIDNIFGLDINWLFDSKFALPALMVMTIWKDFGYAVILFLSGLLSLPSDCYESASIDGASAWQTFRYITLPLLKPTMLFVVVTSIISYLQAYVPVLVMTTGGPGTSTYLSSYLVYDQAFKQYNFGFASAISLFILVLTAIFTVISFKVTGANES